MQPHTARNDWYPHRLNLVNTHSPDGATSTQPIKLVTILNLSTPKDERLSWPGRQTYSGRLTHISGHPSAIGRAWDRESLSAKDRRSTTVPHSQPNWGHVPSCPLVPPPMMTIVMVVPLVRRCCWLVSGPCCSGLRRRPGSMGFRGDKNYFRINASSRVRLQHLRGNDVSRSTSLRHFRRPGRPRWDRGKFSF